MQPIRSASLAAHPWRPLAVMVFLFVCASSAPAQGACPGEGEPCDGVDSDLCAEGVIVCDGDVAICDDLTGDDLESCDGVDNDCNPATADGVDEPGYGASCDGPDADLCKEGVFSCQSGTLLCDDATPDDVDLCDGVDNDCDPGTPDGAADPLVGIDCDGPDSDLCEEGVFDCVAGSLACSDTSPDNLESCDAIDNDCDPGTPDGFDEPGYGLPCDGPDSDLCEEGVLECVAASFVCTDDTGDDPICAPPIPSRSPFGVAVLVLLVLGTAGFVLASANKGFV